MNAATRQAWPLAAFALGLFVLCSPMSAHYWDEYFYAYSASRHSIGTLLSMERALADGIFPNGFFSGKLGFIVLLDGLFALAGTGAVALGLVRMAFAFLTISVAGASYLLLREIVANRAAARQAACVVLLLPISMYLGFKILAEAPSLLLATLGGWQLARAIKAPTERARRGAVIIAALGFALAILVRLTSVLFPIGLTAALLVLRPGGASRRRVLLDAGLALSLAAILASGVYILVLGSPLERFVALAESVTGRTPGAAVGFYSLALFMQAFALVAVLALRHPFADELKGALAWLAVATLPYLLAAQYVEPRFFYTGTLPFALLASTGLDRLTRRVRTDRRAWTIISMLAVLVIVNRLALAPLMPYELQEREYSEFVRDLRRRDAGTTFVAPWLSDYCYLATAFPHERVVLAMSRTYGTGRVFATPEFRQWVGDGRYVSNAAELRALSEPRVYVGWEYSQTIAALDRYLGPLGLGYLDRPARRAQLLNHLTSSWLWDDPHHRLEPIAARGPYRAFRIRSIRP